jgi:hypothetical protein
VPGYAEMIPTQAKALSIVENGCLNDYDSCQKSLQSIFVLMRYDKKGSIQEDLASIMDRLKLNPESWLKSIKNYNRDYFAAVGAIDRIRAYAQALERCWFQGQNAAKSNYCHVVIR